MKIIAYIVLVVIALQGCVSGVAGVVVKSSLTEWKWRGFKPDDRHPSVIVNEIMIGGESRPIYILLYDTDTMS